MSRVDAVRFHDQIGQNNKNITNVINDPINIAKEMLSDGDPFHDRILKQVIRVEQDLKKLEEKNEKIYNNCMC